MHQPRDRIIRNDHGYTLLEALFSITVFILLSHIVVLVYFWIQQLNTTFAANEQVAWELFIQDMQQVFIEVKDLKVSTDSKSVEIFYTNPEGTKKINRSGDVLRLLINNQGNIPLLIGIENVAFGWDGQYINISVIFKNGLEKERRFFVQTSIE